jgi:hypothetical protein
LKKIVVIALLICFAAINVDAQQKQIVHLNQLWFTYLTQSRISKHWGTWSDVLLRTKDHFVNNFSEFIIRGGITYHLNDNSRVTAGYAYVNHFPDDNHAKVSQPEHTPWQQFQWNSSPERFRWLQQLRLEERWRRKILNESELADGYYFNYRIKYSVFGTYLLSKPYVYQHPWSVFFTDELNVNFGKQVVYNYFDQNRFYTGFGWQLTKHDNVQIGYMNIFQQLASGNHYKKINAIRISFLQNLDWRKS